MHITVDETKCCAAGQCVFAAPDIFDQREDDGIVILLNADPPEDQWEGARQAAAVCPAVAIEVRE
ncbi:MULTISPECIES: ferredoxin [Mycobacteriaceae]|uniref:Ferredoxin n=1 Tax=Mycolicibacterium porcinum TaxID=39693 RepID=A0AAW5SZZ9_9MYCO|nr:MULTISPECIES: ferredoxin [Mycobacteriaceae]MCV7387998.1 ferredoxin [Mycolicibacterium porcinum]ORB43462.1 ferredoxin [Mycolicibacterium porcinum]CDO31318.1 ferredoxin [Mycolicibacterium vulneris]